MAYGLPVFGEDDQTTIDKYNNSIEHVKAIAEAAQAKADGNVTSVQTASESADRALERAESAHAFIEEPTDSRVAELVQDTASSTGAVLSATFGRPLNRFAWKMSQGLPVKIVGLGDSVIEGNTVTTPGTDDLLSLLATEWATEYGVTVTKSNRAVSGRTAHTSFTNGDFASAIADEGDLYVISFGHNDLRSDFATPGTGYPKAAMARSVEKMIRRIRDEVPQADIVLLLENPYTPTANTSNPYLVAQNDLLWPLAAFYGVPVADGYTAFVERGDFADLMADTGHPNTAGHRVLADTIKALVPAEGRPDSPSAPGGDLYDAAQIARTWDTATTAQATADMTKGARYVVSGAGWNSTTTAPHASSTADNSIRCLTYGDTAVLRLDCGAGTGTVTLDVDEAVGKYTIDLTTYPSGQRYLPLTGLGAGGHTINIKVSSGTITFRGVETLARGGSYSLDLAADVTKTGTWATNAMGTSSPSGYQLDSTVLGDSLSFTIFGTGVVLAHNKYASNQQLEVQVDGGAWQSVEVSSAASTGGTFGAGVLLSGLEYGRHSIVVRSTGARASFYVYDIAVTDEHATGYVRDSELTRTFRALI